MADDGVPWLDPDEAKAWRSVILLQTHLRSMLARGLQEDGLSESDFEVLVHLSESPDHRLRQNELGRRTGWEKSRLSHHLRRMTDRGLVGSFECPEDSRGIFIVLTDAGWSAISAAAPGHVRLVRQLFFDRLTAEEVAMLGTLGERVFAEPCSAVEAACDADVGDDLACPEAS